MILERRYFDICLSSNEKMLFMEINPRRNYINAMKTINSMYSLNRKPLSSILLILNMFHYNFSNRAISYNV